MLEEEKENGRIKALVEEAQRGGAKAFEALSAMHQTRFRGLVIDLLGRSRPDIAVDDVIQESFLRAFRHIRSFSFRGEDSFLRWLGGIAGNVIHEIEKIRRKEQHFDLAMDRPNDDPSQEMVLRRKERMNRLRDALGGLSPEHRQVLLLSRIEGLSLKEVGRRMGRSHGAVRQLLWRAVQKLKERFGDTESFHLPREPLDDSEGRDG